MDGDREDAQDAAEATFAILTAAYHKLPELDDLIAELSRAQAHRVIRLMASLLGGSFTFAERLQRKPRGSALPTVVQRVREATPWLR